MTTRDLMRAGTERLLAAGIDEAYHDARALLAFVFNRPAMELSALPLDAPAADAGRYDALIERRSKREPLQYILSEAWFMGYRFQVGEGVLIPRADTETVCLCALEGLCGSERVLDLCTGSGALAVSIKKEKPGCAVCAADISPLALSFARRNADANKADITFYEGDFFAPVEGTFDLIVCNPPYIPKGDLATLQEEVKQEPMLALDGGDDGLTFYRRFLSEAPRYLRPRGAFVLELGDGEEEAVRALAAPHFEGFTVFHDLGGLPRALRGTLKEDKA